MTAKTCVSLGVPLALLARLWANRRGETATLTPSELAARDGPLAGLATKYRGQFYWVEFVDIFERLLLCGLTVFAFPHKPGMRVACCQLFLVFKVFLSARTTGPARPTGESRARHRSSWVSQITHASRERHHAALVSQERPLVEERRLSTLVSQPFCTPFLMGALPRRSTSRSSASRTAPSPSPAAATSCAASSTLASRSATRRRRGSRRPSSPSRSSRPGSGNAGDVGSHQLIEIKALFRGDLSPRERLQEVSRTLKREVPHSRY